MTKLEEENCVGKDVVNTLIVEPLICVHDALVAQALASDDLFARRKLREYFANELTIANLKLVIPADGNVDIAWDMKHGEKL